MSQVPQPTFRTYLEDLKQKDRPPCKEPLLHILVTHTAINHVDLLYAHGVHQNNKSGLHAPPFTLGLEFAGLVIDVWLPQHIQSTACRKFRPGDRVWGGTNGSHAEEVIVPASAVHNLPGPEWSLSDVAALGAATFPVSYGALRMIADIKPGETVLVHAAAGGLGVYAVQIARAMNCNVVGTVGSDTKTKLVESLLRDSDGVMRKGEGVVRYDQEGWEKKVVEICKQVGKDGVDVVIDTVGLVTRSIRCTTFNGRIVVVGFAARTGTGRDKIQELETVAVNRLLLKQIKLLGYRYGESGRKMPAASRYMWTEISTLLRNDKKQTIRPVVFKQYHGLDQVPVAMEALSNREVWGKAVVEVRDEQAAVRELQGRHTRSAKL